MRFWGAGIALDRAAFGPLIVELFIRSLLALIERAERGQQSLRVALFSAGQWTEALHQACFFFSRFALASGSFSTPPSFSTGTLAKLPRCGQALQAADAGARLRSLQLEEAGDRVEAQYARRLLSKLG